MKRTVATIALVVLLILGVGIVSYPFVSNYLMEQNLSSEVQSYLDSTSLLDNSKYDAELQKAIEYNKSLIGNVSVADPFGVQPEADDNYYDLLNVHGTSVMAVLEIPVINITYPIYHGADESILSKGIGHLRNTSLPVGGEGVHSVLTGHTGTSQAKLFTDLDKLERDDVFYITVLGETLAYKVDQIKVVLPSDTSDLKIEPDKDYVTLVTCTPYGVNSHRLLVRGSRIPYTREEMKKLNTARKAAQSTWVNEYLSAIIIGGSVTAGILIVYVLVRVISKKIRKRKDNG